MFITESYRYLGNFLWPIGNLLHIFILFCLVHFLYMYGMVYSPKVGLIINSIFLIDALYSWIRFESYSSSLTFTFPLIFLTIVEIILLSKL
jgi:hypothetical protein